MLPLLFYLLLLLPHHILILHIAMKLKYNSHFKNGHKSHFQSSIIPELVILSSLSQIIVPQQSGYLGYLPRPYLLLENVINDFCFYPSPFSHLTFTLRWELLPLFFYRQMASRLAPSSVFQHQWDPVPPSGALVTWGPTLAAAEHLAWTLFSFLEQLQINRLKERGLTCFG